MAILLAPRACWSRGGGGGGWPSAASRLWLKHSRSIRVEEGGRPAHVGASGFAKHFGSSAECRVGASVEAGEDVARDEGMEEEVDLRTLTQIDRSLEVG